MTSHETHRPKRVSLTSTSRSSTSSISSRSTLRSKRSPSPIVFTPAQLTPDTKTIQFNDITRQVFKSLEGFGYLDFLETHEPQAPISEEEEVTSVLEPPKIQPQPPTTPLGSASPAQPKKIDWEIPRKILHSSIGFGTLYLYLSPASPRIVVMSLWSALAIILPADLIRFRSPRFERIYERVLGFLMRESEKGQVNGVVWYILGVNFALTFYPLDVAVVAILILSWADTAASTIGRLWGSKTPPLPGRFLGLPFAPRKSLAGFIAACLTGASIAIAFWGWIAPLRSNPSDITWLWEEGVRHISDSPMSTSSSSILPGATGLLAIGLVAGLISGIAEALDLPGSLDDNLTLPIISGGCLYLLFKGLSFLSSVWA